MSATPFDGSHWTSAPLQVNLQARLNVVPEVVFQALSDPQMMCQVFHWMSDVTLKSANTAGFGVGGLRSCRLANGLVLDEEIVAWQPPDGYVYRGVEATHPFGMRGHVGVCTFQALQSGTLFSWQQYFTHRNVRAMRTQMRESMGVVLHGLIDRFGGQRYSQKIELASE